MSTIEDLEIRGVRNFGDESSKARIHFSKPLTLILGPNGTGKTTIIEALKFITSGEYPPDSERGKSFVHEPKLNHTVRGQVKARVTDKHGRELIAIRTMQVSRQKTGTLKFQALDNTITRIDEKTKQKVQITNRCADIDQQMLVAMGVSKPILNYVIFCHQEESNWPLEDGKKLKDRFDEIFDTSQYNKAMDTNTKLIKDLHVELKTVRAQEEGLKSMVDEVEHREKQLHDFHIREQEGENKIIEIDKELEPIEERSKEIKRVKKDYDNLDTEIKKLQTNYEITTSKIESLKRVIKQIYQGSKEELQMKLDTHDMHLSQKTCDKEKHEHELEEIEKQEKDLSRKLDQAKILLGSLSQKIIAYEEQVDERNKLLSKVLGTWSISQIDDNFCENDVKDYISQINQKLDEYINKMKNKENDNDRDEKYLQREVDQHRSEKTSIDSEITLTDKHLIDLRSDIKEFKEEIKKAEEAGNQLSIVETNLQNATKKYDTLLQEFDENLIKEKLQTTVFKKKELNMKLNQIDQEISSLNQLSSQQAELEIFQKRLQSKEETTILLKNKHLNNLNLLFNGEIPSKNLKDCLEKIQKSLTNEKNNLMKQIDEEQKKSTKLETTLKYNKKELSKIKSELEKYKEQVASQCDRKDYDETLKLQERKVKTLQDQRGIYANQSLMYREYIKLMKKKSCCPLCERGFQTSSEEIILQNKLTSEIEKSPQSLKECEKELEIEQTRYDNLQQLKPVTEQIREIENNKLPKLEAEIAKLEKDIKTTEENLENFRLIISEPEEKLNIYKAIIGDITLLDNHTNERDDLHVEVEKRKQTMEKAGKIGNRNIQEAQNERDALKKRLISIENKIEVIQSELQIGQEKVQKARELKNNLNEEVILIRHGMQALKQLRDKINESYEKEEALEKSLRALRQKLVTADDKLADKIEELNKLKKNIREEREKDMKFKSECENEIRDLTKLQKEVEKYLSLSIKNNLQQVQEAVNRITGKYDDKKKEKLQLEERIRTLNEEVKSQLNRKEELKQNLELIEIQETVKVLENEISEKESDLEKLEFDKLAIEYHDLQTRKEDLEKEKNATSGSLRELQNNIKSLKRDLNQEKYRMARHNYREKQLELTVQEEVIENLKEYVRVLDRAMIQFHEERMDTVNSIMRQLWSLVYSGNDTSAIQIRVKTTEGIGDKKRSYNYKLVQVKRSVEMDMKGKCSAGQKVLASIIIRMALAETFCSDCAILALDEPTTNLDEENATNLARTLSRVIQLRAQHQENFQLIVISHDEKFISHLSNLSGKQIFHQLYRNVDGFSLIKRMDMSNYIKNNSNVTKEEYDSDREAADDDDDDSSEINYGSRGKKRALSLEDSPPKRAFKRRA